MIHYSPFELLFYLFLYAFLSWSVEVCFFAVRDRHFINRGFLNLPVNLPCGLTAVILLVVLPTLGRNYLLQYAVSLIVYKIIRRIAEQFVHNRRHGMIYREEPQYSYVTEQLLSLLISGLFLLLHLVIHPFVLGLMLFVPGWLVELLSLSLSVITAADYVTVRYAMHTGGAAKRRAETQALGNRMTRGIWKRLKKAYPGIDEAGSNEERYVFARGICKDKLVWVFLVSSFLGALIEMLYCRASGDIWMNRSSVLYGPFSFVWGFGAVVLTVVLQRVAQKNDRWVFLAGFVVGGVYEYLCSVFTELVFGTVFWDYSHMPLNIGGRTNVLYCIFWGLLAVLWVKILYPPMAQGIEKIPPVAGKLITWCIVLLMTFNGLLTAGAMIRYTQRQTLPQAENAIASFLDTRYDDAYMENRWPNMKIPETTNAP